MPLSNKLWQPAPLDLSENIKYGILLISFNFVITIHHKEEKLQGNFQGILGFKEQFPDMKADVYANEKWVRNFHNFLFCSIFSLLIFTAGYVEGVTDGWIYI